MQRVSIRREKNNRVILGSGPFVLAGTKLGTKNKSGRRFDKE